MVPGNMWITVKYVDHSKNRDASVFVPLPNGSLKRIQNLPIHSAQKMLGIVTCPSGLAEGSLGQMQEKVQRWLDKVIAGRLHRRMMWISLDCQMWPLLGYGLCKFS
jgi:hypothetical protein